MLCVIRNSKIRRDLGNTVPNTPLIRDTCVPGVVNSSDGRQAMLFTREFAGHDFVRGQFNFLCVTNIFILTIEKMFRLVNRYVS